MVMLVSPLRMGLCYSSSKWPFTAWLTNGGDPNYLLIGMLLQASSKMTLTARPLLQLHQLINHRPLKIDGFLNPKNHPIEKENHLQTKLPCLGFNTLW